MWSQHGPLPVPLHLRNAPTPLMKTLGYGRGYKYAHAQPDQVVRHAHLPDALAGQRYYQPTRSGAESAVADRLERRGPAGVPPSRRGDLAHRFLARLADLGYRIRSPRGAVAQLGERLNGIQEVAGSTPVSSTSRGWVDAGGARVDFAAPESIRAADACGAQRRRHGPRTSCQVSCRATSCIKETLTLPLNSVRSACNSAAKL